MLDEKLQNYIIDLCGERPPLFLEMEEYAKRHHVPIMELSAMETMLQILKIKDPETVFEIGTAIGYSALRMAFALPKSKIITIEREEERHEMAKYFVDKAEKNGQILLIKGDALDERERASAFSPFDVVFIDAAKGQYKKFFDLYSPLIPSGGLVITDNVLFRGLVYNGQETSKRHQKLALKINEFNRWLVSHPQFETVIIPVGDGIAVSRKR